METCEHCDLTTLSTLLRRPKLFFGCSRSSKYCFWKVHQAFSETYFQAAERSHLLALQSVTLCFGEQSVLSSWRGLKCQSAKVRQVIETTQRWFNHLKCCCISQVLSHSVSRTHVSSLIGLSKSILVKCWKGLDLHLSFCHCFSNALLLHLCFNKVFYSFKDQSGLWLNPKPRLSTF